MIGTTRFLIYLAVSAAVFVGLLLFVLRSRRDRPWTLILILASVIVVGGMLFAKWGQNSDLSWLVYYTIPALATVFLPPFVLRMTGGETLRYLLLALLMAPAIHVFFSFCFGWHDYMPFLYVPAASEVLPELRR